MWFIFFIFIRKSFILLVFIFSLIDEIFVKLFVLSYVNNLKEYRSLFN